MRITDLDSRELLSFSPEGGVLRFAGQRALIFDAVALGILRSELIGTIGLTGARGVLTRFGFAHGWRTAQSLRDDFPWDDEREWRIAGGRLHNLQGLVRFETVPPGQRPDLKDGRPEPFAEALWHDSYEAEQHLLHLGQADEPVCWTLCGFASGYLSFCNGREIYCLEERCAGRGDSVCHMVGRPKEEWGDALDGVLPLYQTKCLEVGLKAVTDALKTTERQLHARRKELHRIQGRGADDGGHVARNEAMRRVLDLARRVARVDSTVLLTGESGVGKERVARLIHQESARAAGPFIALNCAAVSESLLESELFGHARGAFTGADKDRPGLFEAAHGGTLLLDEVGEVPQAMQAKLLRVLQEREVRRVGENRSRPIDVRVLAATNRDLLKEVTTRSFRQDLYYRLRVVELRVPPLRERKEDVLPLARLFLAEGARRVGRRALQLSPQAAAQLQRYDWPGNVRELENAIERAVALAGGDTVGAEDLPDEVRMALPASWVPGQVRTLSDVERDYILAVLEKNGGNRQRTADELDIGIATLQRKLKLYREPRAAAGEDWRDAT